MPNDLRIVTHSEYLFFERLWNYHWYKFSGDATLLSFKFRCFGRKRLEVFRIDSIQNIWTEFVGSLLGKEILWSDSRIQDGIKGLSPSERAIHRKLRDILLARCRFLHLVDVRQSAWANRHVRLLL